MPNGSAVPGHESSIRKKYNKWCKLGIFRRSYYDFISQYGGLDENKDILKTLFIDGTTVLNKLGKEWVDVDPTNPTKRATKLVAVTTTKNNKFGKCHRRRH